MVSWIILKLLLATAVKLIYDFNIDSLIVNISYFVVETEDIVLL